jgi:hypothetical protein
MTTSLLFLRTFGEKWKTPRSQYHLNFSLSNLSSNQARKIGHFSSISFSYFTQTKQSVKDIVSIHFFISLKL